MRTAAEGVTEEEIERDVRRLLDQWAAIEALAKRVKPLAESVKSSFLLPCDVEDIASVDNVFAEIKKKHRDALWMLRHGRTP